MINAMLNAHGIPAQKITTVTSDHASNMIKALKVSPWPRVGCFAHMINLAVCDGLKLIPDEVNHLSHAVTCLRKSPAAIRELTVPPVKYVRTRWCSFGKTIDWICEHAESVNRVLLAREQSARKQKQAIIPPFTDDELQLFRDLRDVFRYLNDVLTALQGDKYITMSVAFPLLRNLYDELLPVQGSQPFTIANGVKVAIRSGLDSRWLTKEESEQFCIRCAILLDPRFKTIPEEDQVQEGFRKRVLAEMGKLRRPAPLDGHTQQTGMLRLSAVLKKRPSTVHIFPRA